MVFIDGVHGVHGPTVSQRYLRRVSGRLPLAQASSDLDRKQGPRDRWRRSGGVALTHSGVENVLHHISRLVEPLLRLLWPASGRHRHSVGGAGARPPAPTAAADPNRRLFPHAGLLRGEDSRLVRPYLLAHEQGESGRRECARHRALRLAMHGVDVGPRCVHGADIGSGRVHATEAVAA